MAYLTQYSNSVPVIKFHIDQTIMTIGQDFEMDICIPEDGVAENHATIEAIKQTESYRFVVKSHENETSLDINGETTIKADLHDGDWLIIGGVEFQFTDDGINEIKELTSAPVLPKPAEVKEEAYQESEALKLVKGLKQELEKEALPMSTKDFLAQSRQSRRRLVF